MFGIFDFFAKLFIKFSIFEINKNLEVYSQDSILLNENYFHRGFRKKCVGSFESPVTQTG